MENISKGWQQIMDSIWNKEVNINEKQELIGSFDTEVLIIGAGMAGILTAYYLKEKGVDAVVLEKDRIAGEITGNTTAKITSQHGLIYDKLINYHGMETARLYARANEEAVDEYENLIKNRHIDCHFERVSSYLYSTEGTDTLEKELNAANDVGINAEFTTKVELPFDIKGAVRFKRQAQFNPLEFINGITDDINIYEKTKVIHVRKHMAYTDMGTIKAKNIVFATHYPFVNIPGFYFLRQHQERSYVLALEKIGRAHV